MKIGNGNLLKVSLIMAPKMKCLHMNLTKNGQSV